MNEKYLWNRSGPPDPEIERLEQALAPLRYRPRTNVVRQVRPAARVWWATAAASLLAGVAVWQIHPPAPRATEWQVASLEGTARMGRESAGLAMALRAGQTLQTGRGSELRLEADAFGQIDLGPDSELRAASTRQVQLNHGTLRAFIWARPGQFVVDTPSARATDLGCIYTITVDSSGNGLLKVSFGWVAFQHGGRESFIPGGAACLTRKKQGPGIPYYEDAPEALRLALANFEKGERAAVGTILDSARRADAVAFAGSRPRAGSRCSVRSLRTARRAARGSLAGRRVAARCQDHGPLLERAEPGEYAMVAGVGAEVGRVG